MTPVHLSVSITDNTTSDGDHGTRIYNLFGSVILPPVNGGTVRIKFGNGDGDWIQFTYIGVYEDLSAGRVVADINCTSKDLDLVGLLRNYTSDMLLGLVAKELLSRGFSAQE
jgi:hypothetical protein